MREIVKIIDVHPVTHDVKYFRIEKPAGYHFLPGQATDVSINQPGLEEETRPFTFTSLMSSVFLEFTIKRYADHRDITDKLHQLIPGDELIIRDPWGVIEYKSPGYFIAGGAGITPFIAILRSLYETGKMAGNQLFFSNKTEDDIIYQEELMKMLGADSHFVLTREETDRYSFGRIDESFLKKNITDFNKAFYICGPDVMVSELVGFLKKTGAAPDALVFEK
jgi:ferredoxin-NADP reductase